MKNLKLKIIPGQIQQASTTSKCDFKVPSTVSALPDFVRPLNCKLSDSLLCRLSLAIVLSPVKIANAIFTAPQRGRTAPARHCLIPRGNRFALSTAPKGGIHPEHGAFTKTYFQHSAVTTRCMLKLSTNHYPLITETCNLKPEKNTIFVSK